jgi:two-component system sensor histidine kinase AgrC
MNRILLYVTFLSWQLFIVLYLACYYLFSSFSINHGIIIAIMFLEIALNIYFFKEMLELIKAIEREKIAKLKLEQAEQLLTSFRSKHHDFINHLQVIMGLTQLKHYDKVLEYGRELSRDLIQIEKLISLKRPELAALIMSKISGLSYVETDITVDTVLADLKIQPDILVSIIGNLLDNAIYETAQHDNKWIAINISENSNWYVFEIENPGIIKPEIQDKIFEKGFTTKGKDGSGMGLAIVCDLISKFNGKIDFEIKEDSVNPSVKFTVSLPRLLDSDERRLAG